MTSQYGYLVRHCIRVLDTYDIETQSLEDHVNKYLTDNQVGSEDDQTFIVEVFSGCVRYTPLLNVVMDGFYNRSGKTTLRSEQNLYRALCYLSLFRLSELGMAHFRNFIQTQDINRMYRFFNFFFNDKNLRTWMKDEWLKHYEGNFVQSVLLSPLLSSMPELQDMIKDMKEKIDNKLTPKRKCLSTTETKPFNLSKPRPRSIPIPEPIPKLEMHKTPPITLYNEPLEFERLEIAKEVNRRIAEERLIEANRFQPACANTDKSDKTINKMNVIMSEQNSKLEFDRHKANPVPSFMNQDVPIRMNAAAILREGKLYKKKEEEVIKKLENLEAGARDASDFLKWQTEMRNHDLDIELAEIERRRIEGKLSHEEAILARQNIIRENKHKVMEMKEEAKRMMAEYLEKKFNEEKEMRQLVEDTMQGHQNAKEAQKKLKEYKQKIVQEVTLESRELMKQAVEEAEADLRRKMDLIHQIRAMEAVPIIRQKFVDLTATSGAGLLSEMSIAELRERLSLMKIAEKETEELRRDDILAAKQEKDQMLLDTLETISKHRMEQTRSAAIRLQEKKKSRDQKPEIKDEKLLELQRQLEDRKAERLRMQEASRITPSKYSAQRTRSLNDQKRVLEENRWQELERTRERTAKLSSRQAERNASGTKVLTTNKIALAT